MSLHLTLARTGANFERHADYSVPIPSRAIRAASVEANDSVQVTGVPN